jgi:hypothetical protein
MKTSASCLPLPTQLFGCVLVTWFILCEFAIQEIDASEHLRVSPRSKLQVQIQTNPRYFEFVNRAVVRDVMDFQLPVARIGDLLQGKVWAALDSTRRPSKQLKDLSDIARLLEVDPQLKTQVPPSILAKIPAQT